MIHLKNQTTIDLYTPLNNRVIITEGNITSLFAEIQNIKQIQATDRNQNQAQHDAIDANIVNLNISIQNLDNRTNASIQELNATLTSQLANLTGDLVSVRAYEIHNREDIDANYKNYSDFVIETGKIFVDMRQNFDTQMSVVRKDIAELQLRMQAAEDDQHNIFIGWIVSVIIFGLLFACLGFYLYKNRDSSAESMESVPLRPSRGYSYT